MILSEYGHAQPMRFELLATRTRAEPPSDLTHLSDSSVDLIASLTNSLRQSIAAIADQSVVFRPRLWHSLKLWAWVACSPHLTSPSQLANG